MVKDADKYHLLLAGGNLRTAMFVTKMSQTVIFYLPISK